jgi:protein-S-isoprenylcysteine O-methyltransferase Ste14
MTNETLQSFLPPKLFLACLAIAAALHFLMPGTVLIPLPYSLVGLTLVAGGLWLLLAAHGRFVRARTNIHTFRQPDLLVTDGPFRVSRNPMYLGFMLTLTGIVVCLGTLTPMMTAAAFFAIADRWYIPYEEEACARQFGADYERYRAQVRRWL